MDSIHVKFSGSSELLIYRKRYLIYNQHNKLFEEIKICMEDDGFFDLSGLTEMMQAMDKAVEEHMKKIPQDHILL
jgi:hypothetical protein